MPVAEIFLTAFISVLFGKLASVDLLKFAREEGIYTQVMKWQRTLSNIQAVLTDAEEKQITNIAVNNWLEDLGDLAYDLDDLLDKFATMRNLMAARTDQAITSKLMRFIPTFFTNLSLRSSTLDRNRKISLTQRSYTPDREMSLTPRSFTLDREISLNLRPRSFTLDREREMSLTQRSFTLDREMSLTQRSFTLDREMSLTPRSLFTLDHNRKMSLTPRSLFTLDREMSLTPRSLFKLDRKMRSEIDMISTRLEELFKQKNDLDLKEINVRRSSNRLMTSEVNESRVFGRDNDKRVIVDMLLKDFNEEAIPQSEVFSVIPIVGMGGIGKTTLAQLVYTDKQVTDCFDLKAWVCVSEEFDVFMITKMIFESVTRLTTDSREFKSLDNLQVSLKEKLSKQRFLLVLDDVWNENYNDWDLLCGPLRAGAPRSKIIVTTRHERVASTMSFVPAYPLNILKNDECLSLLALHALGKRDFDAHPSLKETGEAIVRNCKGLPLAAKTLGGLLRNNLSPEYWKEIMNSKIWNIHNCDILPALRLSYNHLPSRLKPLFAYCSIFPNDYEFDRDEVILLWMAEGFLQQSEGEKPMEELGYEYFNELLSRSFFQRSSGNESRFVMHDLMNDLAQVIAGKIFFRLDNNVSKMARHSSFIRQEYEVFKKFKAFHGVKGLRTFLPLPMQKLGWKTFYLSTGVLTDLLPRLQCLRVLSLSGYSISEIPKSIGDLKQLRYLNLSQTLIKCLPESVTDLYNLQTLLLRECEWLTELPSSIGNLINLRHLDCSGTSQLQKMPAGIGKLTSLRTLSKIVLSEFNELLLRDLRSLSDICGTLTIVGLHTVRSIQDPMEANLFSKHGLDEVVMEWTNRSADRNRSLEKKVLNILQPPHRNLKKLKIISYGGTNFPSWVGDTSFSSILNLELRYCGECTSLPSLGQLPLLKNLYISGMDRVKSVGAEFYGVGSFPSLETLTFHDMPYWAEWSTLTGVKVFPCLRELSIWRCWSLIKVSLSMLPSLRLLTLKKCPLVVLRQMVAIASLTTLTVEGISSLTGLQKDTTQFFGALETLRIGECSAMISLWQEEGAWKSLTSLRKLELKSCGQLVSLAGESGTLPQNLKFLSIDGCRNLKKLPSGLNNLKFLQDFQISNCPEIECFPDTVLPPMLTRLEIRSCKALNVPTGNYEGMVMQSNCRVINSGNDEYTEKFSHLEILTINECSSLTSFPTGNFPNTLKYLWVSDCNMLESDVEKPLYNCMSSLELLEIDGWLNFKSFPVCLLKFLHLTRLYIRKCPGLESFPECGLPPNLRRLEICDCENLKVLPDHMQSLTSLEYLQIHGCPSLNSFPEDGFPPKLKELWLGNIGVPILEWGLQRFASLDSFCISGEFSEVVCFPGDEYLLPISLRRLQINGVVNLESLSIGLQSLSSLEELSITECPKLQSLPNKLLSTLSCLRIGRCPLLKQICLKERGEYWPLIAPIPCVEIDNVNIQWR